MTRYQDGRSFGGLLERSRLKKRERRNLFDDKFRLLPVAALAMILTGLIPSSARADVIFDNFDPGGGFDPVSSWNAAYVQDTTLSGYASLRAGVRFTVSGGSFTLDSITLPISLQRDVADNILRVRLADDGGGMPGATLEVLSENQDIWPPPANPFVTTITLTSSLHPLLNDGATYWIVTEPTAVPAGPAPYNVSVRWFRNTVGGSVLVRQQVEMTQDVLPTDPWTGTQNSVNMAFRVEGTPAAAAGAPIPTLSDVGVGVFVVLLAGAAMVAIRRMAV